MKKIYDDKPASPQFTSVLMGGGGPFIECGYCGRLHVAIDSEYLYDNYDSDEERETKRNRYLEMAQTDPDSTILVRDCDSVYYFLIDGKAIPDDCKCNGLRHYEEFFWNNRNIWKGYMMAKKLALQSEIDSIGDIGDLP